MKLTLFARCMVLLICIIGVPFVAVFAIIDGVHAWVMGMLHIMAKGTWHAGRNQQRPEEQIQAVNG